MLSDARVAGLSMTLATELDCELIAALAKTIWHKHYPEVISIEQIDYMLDLMYSADALRKQMADGQKFQLLNNDSQSIGYISHSETMRGDVFLHKFYVENVHQRKGLGSIFFRELLHRLDHPKTIRLTVNRKNFKSINFYFKNGFTIERVADFDIGQGFQMNDFVMLYNRTGH